MDRRAVLVRVALALGVAIVGGDRGATPARCPAGMHEDAARADGILSMVRALPADGALAEHARSPLLCFGERARSTVTGDGVLLIDERASTAEAAARVAHLLAHLDDRATFEIDRGDDCDARVAAALSSEARALVVEIEARAALGVTAPHDEYEFTASVLRAAPDERAPIVFDYLERHPHGAPGLDAFADAYAARCHAARRH